MQSKFEDQLATAQPVYGHMQHEWIPVYIVLHNLEKRRTLTNLFDNLKLVIRS